MLVSELPGISVSDILGEAPQFLVRGGLSTTRRRLIIRILCRISGKQGELAVLVPQSQRYCQPRLQQPERRVLARAQSSVSARRSGPGSRRLINLARREHQWELAHQPASSTQREPLDTTGSLTLHIADHVVSSNNLREARLQSGESRVGRGPASWQHRSCSRGVARRKGGGVSGLKRATLGRGMHQPRGDSQEARQARQNGTPAEQSTRGLAHSRVKPEKLKQAGADDYRKSGRGKRERLTTCKKRRTGHTRTLHQRAASRPEPSCRRLARLGGTRSPGEPAGRRTRRGVATCPASRKQGEKRLHGEHEERKRRGKARMRAGGWRCVS